MGIYNRSYMRAQPQIERPWAVKTLLIIMVTVFVIQNILRHWFGSHLLEDLFTLSLGNVFRGFVHTFITYGFLHSTEQALPWHLVFNALFIWWFGKVIEDRYGSKKFIEIFICSILSGGLIWIGIQFLSGNAGFLLGASAGAYGILYLFCRLQWNHQLSFLFIPVQFSGKHLFYIILGFQAFFFLFSELPGRLTESTAYSAHLGGILGAYLYEKFLVHKSSILSIFKRKPRIQILPPSWEKKNPKTKASIGAKFKVNVRNEKELRGEVDRILDKINVKGFGSLTQEEKEILDQAKNRL